MTSKGFKPLRGLSSFYQVTQNKLQSPRECSLAPHLCQKSSQKHISDSKKFRLLNFNNENKVDSTQKSHYLDKRQWDKSFSPFAVNLEYFLLDRNFPCHRPSLNAYFEEKLAYKKEMLCILDAWVHLKGSQSLVNGDPSSLTGVELVLVSPGQSLIERFGHVMMRLTYKNKIYGLSYYANKKTGSKREELTFLSGMSDSFRVTADLYEFERLSKNYEKEGRSLYFLKLDLTHRELLALGKFILESLFYENRIWHNLFQNCIVNTWNLIEISLSEESSRNLPTFQLPQTPESFFFKVSDRMKDRLRNHRPRNKKIESKNFILF